MSTHTDAVGVDAGSCPLMPTYGPPSVMFVRGEGCWLWDREDTRYLDFLSGIAVVSLGHAHPKVAEAVAEQARTLCHVSNLYATEPQMHVARTIDRIVGGPPGQVFFATAEQSPTSAPSSWPANGPGMAATP